MRLEGKVAVVVGTSLNIGGAIASGFAAEGAKVACNDINPAVSEGRAERIKAAGGEAISIPGDCTDEEIANAAIQTVVDTWGHVDILVNGASIFITKGLLDISLEEYRRQIDICVTGNFLWTRAAAKSMIEKNIPGSIITIISGAGWQGQPGNIGYSTGKGSLTNFVRSAAMELAQFGIRVNSFTPSATQPEDPDLIESRRKAAEQPRPEPKYMIDRELLLPMGRLAKPSDYVPAFIYLASDDSMMVTGTDMTVDGGARAKYWSWVPHPRPAGEAVGRNS